MAMLSTRRRWVWRWAKNFSTPASSAHMNLQGKTILTTRAAAQSGELRKRLEDLGARVIECPTIQIVDPADWSAVDEAILRLNSYQWLLFTSANAVEQFMKRVGGAGLSCRIPIAVVGSATAHRLK